MVRCWSSTLICRAVPFLVAVIVCSASSRGGEIKLKNGTVLNGNLWLMSKMSDPPMGIGRKLAPKDAAPVPRNIVLVDNGWQKYYVPLRQIPDEDVDKDILPSRPESFSFDLVKVGQSKVIATVGHIVGVTDFNEHGQRTISIATQQKDRLDVIQAISRIEPDHVVLDALKFNWKMGLSLRAVPAETLNTLLRQKVKRNDPISRFALVRFYSQAEMYQEAFVELDAILTDFPDQQARVNGVRAELMDYFGREVLRELNRRRAAGQHLLAHQYALTLTGQKLGGAVMDDVRKFLNDYEEMGKSIRRAKGLLSDWQSKLKEAKEIEELQPLRNEINEQLDVETLPRMDAFLQAEADPQLSVTERLALAYSGWVVGAANATTDLVKAKKYWDARYMMLEALRADSPKDHYREMRGVKEYVGPKVFLQLAALLPPILDGGEIQPGRVHRVQVTPEEQSPSIAYSVLLPPEYSPHHNYPLLIALRSREHSNRETIRWWGGDAEQPGPAMRRGYILIVPEYAEERQSEYTYGALAHQVVIDSLRDARKRFSVDSNRVFLAGHGMGADAAFDLGMAHPDEFAGVIPIGGECQHYPKITVMNGRFTAWYVIGRGFNMNEMREGTNPTGQRDLTNNDVFDKMFIQGFQFDFMLVEYLGRGVDRYLDEVPKLFDWMDLHRRKAMPKDFEVFALRKTDNRQFWVTVDLPWTVILPAPAETKGRPNTMKIAVTTNEGNHIRIESPNTPGKRFQVRLGPDAIDFDRRVKVTKSGRQVFYDFVTPESADDILDELRATGDRNRLPLATLNLPIN